MKQENFSGTAGAKQELRRKMRAVLRDLTPERHAQASLEISRQAAVLPAFLQAKVVALFAPLPTEPDLRPLIEEAWARGKRVVFPLMRREGEAPLLEWHQVTGWDELVIAGPWGIREPDPARCAPVAVESIDCVFVPGLAFDARGGRLGRGGGYYDAALAGKAGHAVSIGLMFLTQEVEEVPREAHDQTLDGVVNEKGFSPSCHPDKVEGLKGFSKRGLSDES